MSDGKAPANSDEAAALAALNSRKNSILVKDENGASRVNMQAAHPHFVEQNTLHRAPPGLSGANPAPPGAQGASEQLARFHFGPISEATAPRADAGRGSPPLPHTSSQGGQTQNAGPQPQVQAQAQAVAHAQAQAEAQEQALAEAKAKEAISNQHKQSQPQVQPTQQQQQQPVSSQQLQQGPQGQPEFFIPPGQPAQPQSQSQYPFPQKQQAPSSTGSYQASRQGSPRGSLAQLGGAQPQQQSQGAHFRSDLAPSLSTASVPSTASVQPGIPRVNSPGVLSSDGETGTGTGPVGGRSTSKQPSDPRIPMNDGKIHILIGVTGSLHMSSVKSMITKLQSIYGDRVAIQVIVTPAAEKLVAAARAGGEAGAATAAHPLREKEHHSNLHIWHDHDEWDTWRGRNDPVIHIELRRWADILVIAPLSANTLGKIALGLCDNLLTNVVRAWNSQYPILIAPAMVSYAYNNPATKHQLKIIKEEMKWIEILRPTEKVAGSTGGIGMGGMMPWNEIVDRIVHKLGGYPDEDEEDDDDDDDREDLAGEANDEEDDDDDDDAAGILTDGFDSAASADVQRGSPL